MNGGDIPHRWTNERFLSRRTAYNVPACCATPSFFPVRPRHGDRVPASCQSVERLAVSAGRSATMRLVRGPAPSMAKVAVPSEAETAPGERPQHAGKLENKDLKMKLRLQRPPLPASGRLAYRFAQTKTIKAVMHSDRRCSIRSGSPTSGNHGYMVWDTCSPWTKLQPQLQMVDSFTPPRQARLHLYAPMTQMARRQARHVEDCIASLKRWGARDTGPAAELRRGFEAVSDKTFKIVEGPYGLVIDLWLPAALRP